MTQTIFHSYKNGFYKYLLWCFVPLWPILFSIIILINRNVENIIGLISFGLFAYLLMFFFSYNYWYKYRYVIENNRVLVIKIASFELAEINILSIKSISKNRKSSYVYATSDYKLISIKTHDNKEWNISPLEREEFIELILKINPNIENLL
jgi:hypothetical protein